VGAIGVLTVATAVTSGAVREKRALPLAADRLRLAVIEAAEVDSCFQGVQDDLYIGTPPVRTPITVASARQRLRGCDLMPLREAVEAIRLPPPPSLSGDGQRKARDAIDQAVALLRHLILDASGTKKAMESDIDAGTTGMAVVIGYRSVSASYLKAVALSALALALTSNGRPTT
jgi:hypothetical protein